MFEFPFLVYKSALPDNSELMIVNTSISKMTQSRLNLGDWEFISFVNTAQMQGTGFENKPERNIFIIVRHRSKGVLKLAYIEDDPWKVIDEGLSLKTVKSLFKHDLQNGAELV
jgi:hypothetical protein